MKSLLLLCTFIALPSMLHSMDEEPCTLNMAVTSFNLEHEGKLPDMVYLEGPKQSVKILLYGTVANRVQTLTDGMNTNPGTRKLTFEYPGCFAQYDLLNGNRNPRNPDIWPK